MANQSNIGQNVGEFHCVLSAGPKSITFARLEQSVFTWTQRKDKAKTDQEVRHPKLPRNPTRSQSDWSSMPTHTDLYFHWLDTTIYKRYL